MLDSIMTTIGDRNHDCDHLALTQTDEQQRSNPEGFHVLGGCAAPQCGKALPY